MKVNQENIFTRETVKHITSFTFYLNYTDFPDIPKDRELSTLNFIVSKL